MPDGVTLKDPRKDGKLPWFLLTEILIYFVYKDLHREMPLIHIVLAMQHGLKTKPLAVRYLVIDITAADACSRSP